MTDIFDPNLNPEEVRDLPAAKRIPYIRHIRLRYPRYDTILKQIRHCYDSNDISADPGCLLLVGPTGAGKTTLLEVFLQEHPRTVTEETKITPVLMSTVDVPATVGNFASGILRDLGDPRSFRGTIRDRLHRIEKFIQDCGVKMLILDETQHIVDRDSDKVLRTVSDGLKGMIKRHHLACVLSGLQDDAERVVESNPQLARLFPDRTILAPFIWNQDDPDTIKEWRDLLRQLEKALPLRENSRLSNRDMAWRIHFATDGLMGFLMTLIREATYRTIMSSQEYIDEQLLAEVFAERLAGKRRGIPNPFVDSAPAYISPKRREKARKLALAAQLCHE